MLALLSQWLRSVLALVGSEGWDEGGGGRSDGGVLIMSWKLSSVAGSLEI